MALEAELIYAITSRGLSWEAAQEMELWQIAAALGMHRIETRAQKDEREIIEAKREYFEQTKDARMEKMAEYSENRRRQAEERRQAKARQREESRNAR